MTSISYEHWFIKGLNYFSLFHSRNKKVLVLSVYKVFHKQMSNQKKIISRFRMFVGITRIVKITREVLFKHLKYSK